MTMPKVDVDDEDESKSSWDDDKNDVGGGNVGKDGVHGFEGVLGGGRYDIYAVMFLSIENSLSLSLLFSITSQGEEIVL